MSWHLDDVDSLSEHAARWTELAEGQHGHPFLQVRLIQSAAKHFGERLILGRYDRGREIEAMIVLRMNNRWVCETFAPAQVPLALLVAGPGIDLAKRLPELFSVLPTTALQISVLHTDSRYLDLTPANVFPSRLVPYAETISIEGVDGFAEYAAARPKKLRDNIKRYKKRLNGRFESVELDVLSETSDMEALVESHGALEALGWKGREGSALTQDANQRSFYVEALRDFARSRSAVGFQLKADGQVLASRFGIIANGIFVFLKTAYSEEHRDLAPGRVLQWLAIENVLETLQPSTIEFYTKADADQRQWGTSTRMISHLDIPRSGLVARGIDAARRLRIAIRRGRQAST